MSFILHYPTYDGEKGYAIRTTLPSLNGGLNLHTVTVKCTPVPTNGMKRQVVHGLKL